MGDHCVGHLFKVSALLPFFLLVLPNSLVFTSRSFPGRRRSSLVFTLTSFCPPSLVFTLTSFPWSSLSLISVYTDELLSPSHQPSIASSLIGVYTDESQPLSRQTFVVSSLIGVYTDELPRCSFAPILLPTCLLRLHRVIPDRVSPHHRPILIGIDWFTQGDLNLRSHLSPSAHVCRLHLIGSVISGCQLL